MRSTNQSFQKTLIWTPVRRALIMRTPTNWSPSQSNPPNARRTTVTRWHGWRSHRPVESQRLGMREVLGSDRKELDSSTWGVSSSGPYTHTKRNRKLENFHNGPRGSRFPNFAFSGPKQKPFRVWFLEPETSNIGYLNPLGWGLFLVAFPLTKGCACQRKGPSPA